MMSLQAPACENSSMICFAALYQNVEKQYLWHTLSSDGLDMGQIYGSMTAAPHFRIYCEIIMFTGRMKLAGSSLKISIKYPFLLLC